jgi:quinol monooxygenase YgiN
MSTPVSWHLNMEVREGKLEDLRALMEEMVESTRGEEGTLAYEWFLSDDTKTCHLYERYRHSEAAMVHLNTFADKFALRFLECLEPHAIHVYGEPSDELRRAHSNYGAVFLGTLGGFTRD